MLFDNGFFVAQTRFAQQGVPAMPASTELRPTAFNSRLTAGDIATRYGTPDQVETARYGLARFDVHRYLSPARGIKSFTFLDGRLVGVAAGFAISGGELPAATPGPSSDPRGHVSDLEGVWEFGRVDGTRLCSLTLTNTRGKHGFVIKGCHPNESFWTLDGGHLLFMHADGVVTSRLTLVAPNRWEGPFVPHPSVPKPPTIIDHYIKR